MRVFRGFARFAHTLLKLFEASDQFLNHHALLAQQIGLLGDERVFFFIRERAKRGANHTPMDSEPDSVRKTKFANHVSNYVYRIYK